MSPKKLFFGSDESSEGVPSSLGPSGAELCSGAGSDNCSVASVAGAASCAHATVSGSIMEPTNETRVSTPAIVEIQDRVRKKCIVISGNYKKIINKTNNSLPSSSLFSNEPGSQTLHAPKRGSYPRHYHRISRVSIRRRFRHPTLQYRFKRNLHIVARCRINERGRGAGYSPTFLLPPIRTSKGLAIKIEE